MRQIPIILLLLTGAAFAWYLGSRLSSDALGFALGAVFGILAGVPTALLVLAANRRGSRQDEDDEDEGGPHGGWGPNRQPSGGYFSPPVVVVTGAAQPAQQPQYGGGQQPAQPWPQLPAPPPRQGQAQPRTFKIVGEKEEWLDEW